MLSKQASHALKALLVLAAEPLAWQSTHALAVEQQLPEPMLEQVLLRLRRAGLLTARRGRLGGYRLARPAREISLWATPASGDKDALARPEAERSAADQVTAALERRLERARQKALAELSLEDLLFDLRSAEASRDVLGGVLLG
ncbi:MAG: Rrf2 family transcriptional regulator [Synechococcaceae bacterium WB9_2_112]|nr:Rrf2 family transcriptional regulator [Synechococcaceae bacterium WB9_2_112]